MDWEEISKEEFAEYVNNMRKAAGISEAELAEYMNLSTSTIKNYENPGVPRMPRDMFPFMVKLQQVCTDIIKEKREMGK